MKKVLQFPSLHTTTNVSWCYLNYIKPNHIQQVDRRSSVYASWCISLYNPNLPGISTKVALSLLRSKQKVSRETYTMATAPRPEAGRLVPSSSRKPKMTEVMQSYIFLLIYLDTWEEGDEGWGIAAVSLIGICSSFSQSGKFSVRLIE